MVRKTGQGQYIDMALLDARFACLVNFTAEKTHSGTDNRRLIAVPEARTVPCGPINTLAEVFADPQVQARGLQVTMPHSVAGSVSLVANPMKFSATSVQYRISPPMLGEHTDNIFAHTLSFSPEVIAQSHSAGVV